MAQSKASVTNNQLLLFWNVTLNSNNLLVDSGMWKVNGVPLMFTSITSNIDVTFTTCTACQEGTYQNSTQSNSCIICPSGTYNTGNYNQGCTDCKRGEYSSGN